MRVALVSPYSWSYPGGVTRHVMALAEQLRSEGNHVRVLAPFDPPGRRAALLHQGSVPQPMSVPNDLVTLGPTVGVSANGAVSNLAVTASATRIMLRELRTGCYDVVHIHEPVAPPIGWFAAARVQSPLVGTFHAYSENPVSNGIANFFGARRVLDRLHVRIAVSEAAAWTGRHWFGGQYRVVPNGVHVRCREVGRGATRRPSERLRLVFVGQPVQRKGLPVLLDAFRLLRHDMLVDLVLVGPSPEDLPAGLCRGLGIRALGKVEDETKWCELERADVLCAPSLGGESFGMVLTEAFAAATPVVASDIAGYRDVVRHGVNGMLVPPADSQALAETLRELCARPKQLAALSHAAVAAAERFAWPTVAASVVDAYLDAIAAHRTRASRGRAAVGGTRAALSAARG